ncbi:MAG: hypothetical protein Q7S23_01035 [bacterium]|nr:hypothetical protein [bacterium]
MRPLVHFATLLTPVAVLVLMGRLFSVPDSLPWVVTVVGLLVSGVTVMLVRPGLARLAARPLTSAGLLLGGVLLVISTPLLGFQQVLTVTEAEGDTGLTQLPWVVTAVVLISAGTLVVFAARRITLLPQTLTPVYLAAGEVLLLSALEGYWFRRLVAGVFALLLFVALEDLYLAFHEPNKHQDYAPVNIASYLAMVTYFLYAAGLLWLMVFFAFPLWLAALLLAGIALLLTYQALWALGIPMGRGWPYLVSMPLLTMEFLWAVSFLPTSVYVGALVLTAGWYVASGCSRNQLLGTLDRRVVLRYVVTSAASLAVVLLTAKCDVAISCVEMLIRFPALAP